MNFGLIYWPQQNMFRGDPCEDCQQKNILINYTGSQKKYFNFKYALQMFMKEFHILNYFLIY